MAASKITQQNESVCLQVVHSVTKNKTVYVKLSGGEEYPETKEIFIKQIRVKKWFKKDGITSIEEYVTATNKIAKSRCIVYDKYSGRFYVTFHKSDEVINAIASSSSYNPIGFKK